jgi:hypothetical protein
MEGIMKIVLYMVVQGELDKIQIGQEGLIPSNLETQIGKEIITIQTMD